jgi:hypothetical protein
MPSASLAFPPDLRAVGQARGFLLTTLAEWDAERYAFAGPLVLTELATNAALHARTPYEVRLRLEPEFLVVEVVDHNPRRPQVRGYDADATTGRGIGLVDSLCASWGVRGMGDGKVVWAQVRPDDLAGEEFNLDDTVDDDHGSVGLDRPADVPAIQVSDPSAPRVSGAGAYELSGRAA